MGSYITNDVQSTNQKVVIVTGTFTTDGSGDIASSGSRNKHVTAAHDDTGEYSVTLSQKVPAILSAHLTLESASAIDVDVQIASITNQVLNIITRDNDGGAAADLVSSTVHFTIFVDALGDG